MGAGFTLIYLVGSESVQDSEVSTIEAEVRQVCWSMELRGCDTSIQFLWKDDPFKTYAGMAPFMFFSTSQIILLDKTQWNKLSYLCKRELVAHEMGHALLGWSHHADNRSIMTTEWNCREDLTESFRRAKEIEND